MPRPNLLYVFADQMRSSDMGCVGNPDVLTPNLDRFASESCLFESAYANCPVCTPSRGVLLTGRYPFSTGVLANDLPLSPEIPGIGKAYKSAGYRTGYIGKWHLDGVPRARFTPPGPRRHGFDYWAVWNCAHRYFGGQYYTDSPEPITIEGYEPAGQTDLAIEFMERKDDRPFCLFLSWGPPHDPYTKVPPGFREKYNLDILSLRGNVQPIKKLRGDGAEALGPAECLAYYYAAITALDEQFGRLLAKLDELGLAENTIVVFTSDHGDMLWSQGMLKKQQPWEESAGIPFVVRWPGKIPEGARPDVLLSTIDFVPTLLSLCEVPGLPEMHGSDLSEVFLGRSREGPEAVYLMDVVTVDEAGGQGLHEWRGVRTKSHTYAEWVDGGSWLLYDNVADPLQLTNLASAPRHLAERERLEGMLGRLKRDFEDPCLPWREMVRRHGLVDLWNERERELHPKDPRLL